MARRQFDQEENRLDYGQLLHPEEGYTLDFAAGATYSLDLEALLGVPVSLGMLADLDSGSMNNPYFLLEAIRKSSGKIAIFCNADGIHLPQNIRPVYALLENSLFPVALGSGSNFHPKTWVIRYTSPFGPPIVKVLVLSRNLTFDRSMDIVAELVGTVGDGKNESHRPLADFLQYSATFASAEMKDKVRLLARDVMRVDKFLCEEPFETYRFLPFGIPRYKNRALGLLDDARSLIVVSPFLSKGVIDALTEAPQETALISRTSSVTPEIYQRFQSVYVPKEAMLDDELLEETDAPGCTKRDLHAKIFFKSNHAGNFLYLGSLNASANAFYHNVEFMLELKYKPYYASFNTVLKDLIPDRNCPFELLPQPTGDVVAIDTEDGMNPLADAIEAIKGATVVSEGSTYCIMIECGELERPAEIAPLYRNKAFQALQSGVSFSNMVLRELSELYVIRRDDTSCVAKIPTQGIPTEERDNAIYNAVIGDKSGFLAYVSFLLSDNYAEAGIEQQALMDLLSDGCGTQNCTIPTALYERLLQTAARNPERLSAVDELVKRLDPELVDESFHQLIDVFRLALKGGQRR